MNRQLETSKFDIKRPRMWTLKGNKIQKKQGAHNNSTKIIESSHNLHR